MAVQISGNDITVPRDGSFTRNVTIGGTLTYEDVTNIDSVGLVTARNGIEIGARPGVAASISVDGNMIVSGISTFGGNIAGQTASFAQNLAIRLSSATNNLHVHQDDSDKSIAQFTNNTTGSASGDGFQIGLSSSEEALLNMKESSNMVFKTADTERLRIDSSGRLLLGLASDSRTTSMIISGNTSGATSFGVLNIDIGTTSVSADTNLGIIRFGATGDRRGADIRGMGDGTWNAGSSHPTRLSFYTCASSATSPTEKLRINSSGQVLIGSTSSRNVGGSTTNSRLQIEGTSTNTSSLSLVNNSADTAAPFVFFGKTRGNSVGESGQIQNGDTLGGLSFIGADGTDTNNRSAEITAVVNGSPANNTIPTNLVFSTSSANAGQLTERFRLFYTNTGNGGIAKFTSPASGDMLNLQNDTASGQGFIIGVDTDNDYTYLKNNTSATYSMAFQVNGAERVRIDPSGRLLVGTTSARNNFAFTTSAKIQAEGAYNQGSISSTNTENSTNTCAFVSAKIRGTGAVSNNDIVGSHVFEGYEGSAFRRIARIDGIARNSGGGISNNVISGDLAFYTRIDGNAEAEVVRFHHAKYALFGCNSLPSGSVGGASIDCDPSDYPVYFKSSSAQYGASAYTHYQFFNTNGSVGQILINGSGTSFVTSSDYRLKENQTAITDGITRIKQLKPYKFNFKADSNTVLDGFFAHEVSSVVPEAVSGEKDAVATEANVKSGIAENVGDVVPQGLDHAKLVPLLTAALQEAITKIETLETKVAALEG